MTQTQRTARPNEQIELARKALETKQAGQDANPSWTTHQEPTHGDGPIADVNQHEPVMGAFDAEGHRPVLERSRKVR